MPGFEKLDWKNGIHVSKIKPCWKIPLEMVQNYITCDGRYDRVLKFHLRLLMHLSGSLQLNLPLYLLKSLQKIISWVQGHPEHTARSVYHQGLIKLLIFSQLHREGPTWETLLIELGLEENTKEKGKRIMEDSDQQTTNHKKQIEAVVEEGNGFIEKPVQKSLRPETSFTDENPEKLSVILKNITSKNEAHD